LSAIDPSPPSPPSPSAQWLTAAAAAAGHQQHPHGALYLVATPIGNRADITLRALHVLALADAVACEDTRVTAQLLQHLGLGGKPLLALHAHNEREAAARVVQRLDGGARVVFVSDAGTPAVSDPGARLVAAVVAAGHRVLPIPGPSAALAALSAAGDVAGGGFAFHGFLPAKGAERHAALQAVTAAAPTQILFEAPHRIAALLAELAALAPQRTLTVARELTKQFEQIHTLPAAAAPAWLAADAQRARGEFVLVLHAQPAPAADDDALPAAAERALAVLLRELPLKQAVALAAEIGAAPRNALYRRALHIRGAAHGEAGGD
jgi:16S rRNA (cytidine1402-2'-O)-methyltransferase